MKHVLVATIVVFCLPPSTYSQGSKPLTHKQACERFMPAVVRINVADGEASGFIVSADGWIMTAAHVVFDMHTRERLTSIAIEFPDGSTQFGKVFVDRPSVIRDFALLKVNKAGLPHLALGSEADIGPGSDVAVIGYPFSAEIAGVSATPKFCMFGSITATESLDKLGTHVDAIYFQGPAVKGISGGPIISLDSGQVVGIQSEKLAGITSYLDEVRNRLAQQQPGNNVLVFGASVNQTLSDLIDVLDRHLVNGLGAATAIDDAKILLGRAQRQNNGPKNRQH